MERKTTNQDGLNALVAKKIEQKLAAGMVNVQKAGNRLLEEGKIQRDFLFEVGAKRKGVDPVINFIPDGTKVGLKATFNMPKTGKESFVFNDWSTRQVAEKLSIPTAYLLSLLAGEEWQRTLGYEILNSHNGYKERSQVLVRALGNKVRAVLSDSYRPLDSEMIFGAHIEEVYNNGAQLSDGFMDDTRINMESLLPSPIKIVTPLNGEIWVAFGMKIESSDVGAKLLTARSYLMQGVCLNGMVTESVLKEKHLGTKLMRDNSGMLSEKTYRLDSEATASAVKDITKYLYSSNVIKDKMLQIEASATDTVEPQNVLNNLRGMGKLLKGESEEIGQMLMRNQASQGIVGESTIWKITQGITAYANSESVSESRRLDLQEIAGELFTAKRN